MKHIKYLIALLAVAVSLSAPGQDSIPVKKFLLFGFDLYGPVYQFIQPSDANYEGSFALGLFKKIYPTFELGYMNINRNSSKDTLYHYSSKGNFMRFGIDYNIFKRKHASELYMVFIGCRYSFANLNYTADNIIIYDNIWGDEGRFTFGNKSFSGNVNAQWLEFTAGIRAEVFKNFALGWTVRYSILTRSTGMDLIKPVSIPGYGSGTNTSNIGFTYSIYYILRFQKQ
jgi:hypothetical protein